MSDPRPLRPGDKVKLFFRPKHVNVEPPKRLDGTALPWSFGGEYMQVTIIGRDGDRLIGLLDTKDSFGGYKFGEEVRFLESDAVEKYYNDWTHWLMCKAIYWMRSI